MKQSHCFWLFFNEYFKHNDIVDPELLLETIHIFRTLQLSTSTPVRNQEHVNRNIKAKPHAQWNLPALV